MGWPILITVEIAALVCLYFALTQHLVVAGITFVLLSFAGSLFFSLTVVATRETLMVRFGPGLVRKSFKIKDVSSIRPITTSVWNGWGIRFMGDGTVLFNVSGFKAVKLTTTNGKSFAIGTDEPDKLVAFVENARRSWA
jgi:hypothetical protein